MAALVVGPFAAATTTRAIDPLKGVDSIVLDIMIGQSIRVDDPEALSIFGDQYERANSFDSALRSRLGDALRLRGITVKEEAAHTLSLSFYGGSSTHSKTGCGGIFLLEISIVAQPDANLESEVLYQRGVLGTFDPQEPEVALAAAAEAVLEDLPKPHSQSEDGSTELLAGGETERVDY